MTKKWHAYNLNKVEEILRTDLTEGLTAREARIRLEKEKKKNNGYRRSLFVSKKKSAIKCLTSFIVAPSMILLLIISLLATMFGRFILGASIFIVAFAGAIVGGIINLTSQRRLEAMKNYASPMTTVKRGGNIFKTDGRNVVSGDIILLKAGDILPCDARLVACDGLVVEEIVKADKGMKLRRVEKDHSIIYADEDNAAAPNAENMLYAGSAVVSGKAIAVATDTAGNVYLAQYLPDGALAAKDGETEAIKSLNPVFYKIVFISASGFLILSLLSLLTLKRFEFLSVFMMLLSSIVLVTSELLSTVTLHIFSSRIRRLSLRKKNRTRDTYAAVRNIKTLDSLTELSDLVLVGKVGLSDGVKHIYSAYIANGEITELIAEDSKAKRLLGNLFTYVKVLRDSGVENHFSENGYDDSFFAHIKNSGFDYHGASLALKSTYYATERDTGIGFACAETALEAYRVALTLDSAILMRCDVIRDGDKVRDILESDTEGLASYEEPLRAQGLEIIYIISEYNGRLIFEGALAITEHIPTELQPIIDELDRLGVKRTVILSEENEENIKIANSFALAPIFDGEIAYASFFRRNKKDITYRLGEYCAYIGFDDDEYCTLITSMRKAGKKVATYGIDNSKNKIMAVADVAISCDTINYSNEKHGESIYERTYPEGRDNNLRCSQQTRLLSRVIVRRTNEKGGGLWAIAKAVFAARASYVTLAQAILLFIYLMSNVVVAAVMSVLTGNLLLNSLQTVVLSVVFAFLSFTVFNEFEYKGSVLSDMDSYLTYPIDIVKNNFFGIVARASVGVIMAIATMIMNFIGVFGDNPSFTLPVYIFICLTPFVEVMLMSIKYTKKGEQRKYCWLKVTVAYAMLLRVVGMTTYGGISAYFFPNGIGTVEFFLVAGYAFLYGIALLVTYFVDKKKKKA